MFLALKLPKQQKLLKLFQKFIKQKNLDMRQFNWENAPQDQPFNRQRNDQQIKETRSKPSFDLGIDPKMREKIEEQIRKEQALQKIKAEVVAEQERRRKRLEEKAQKVADQKKKYRERLQNQLDTLVEKIREDETKSEQKQVQEKLELEEQLQKIREKGEKTLQKFEEKAEQKRKELQNKIEHERKVIQRLNKQSLEEAEKMLTKKNMMEAKNQQKIKEELNRKKDHLNYLIEKVDQEVNQALLATENDVIEKQLEQEQRKEIEKRTSSLFKRKEKQNTTSKVKYHYKLDQMPLSSSTYDEQYLKSKSNVEKVLKQQDNFMRNLSRPYEYQHKGYTPIMDNYMRDNYDPWRNHY